MNILYLAQRVPYPPSRGDKIASYHAVRYLAAKHSLFVGALAHDRDDLEHARELKRLGVEVDVALRHPSAARLAALHALVTGAPLSIAYYRSKELARAILHRAATVRFDAVIAFCSSMGQYADLLPALPLIADLVDLDSSKWQLYAAASQWPHSAVYAAEQRRLLAYERRLAKRAAVAVVRTEAEREDCLRLIPEARFEVVSNGVDLAYFSAHGAKPTTRNIVFTGVMDYFPNVHAVEYFCREILPRIRQRILDATFTIVGSRPNARVRRLENIPGVAVTGEVPDVRPYLRAASVAVAPLLLARGIQNKVLEAMAMNTPVVTTPAAFRGIDAAEGDGIFVAHEPGDFATKVVRILEDPRLASEMGKRARAAVEKRYVWDEQLASLERLISEAAGETTALRLRRSKEI
jgi:sugar transferase (PEP-CTERM/EpsH1 system associated)